MALARRCIHWSGLLLSVVALVSSSHDGSVGVRYVDPNGVNASDCLEHHEPCQSIQYALAQALPGNTVKVAAGIYDMSGVDPESYLFGAIRAQGGYEGGHFDYQDRDANTTVLVGVDARYRQPLMHMGFKWAGDIVSARQGIVDDSPAPALQATAVAPMTCVQGLAGQFPCRNVDFQAQIPLNGFSSQPVSAANLWGLVDLNDNREYAVIGLSNGTSVVDVSDPVNPRQVGFVPGPNSSWREVKIYQHFDAPGNRYRAYAYITTEARNTGLQVIDLSGLPNSVSLANTLTDTGSQHTDYVSNIDYATNMALPGSTAYLYVAGSNIGGGSWRVYSLANPAQPQLIRQAPAGTGYMHDSTSMLITDQRTTQCALGHNPCEILVDFNETTVDLWDVTDKTTPVMLSSTTYSDVAYTHSGWPSVDQHRIFVHDELEEINRGLFTQIYTMNVDDLRNPFIQASYQGPDTTIDHNGYTKGNLYYVSHYRRGLEVFDVTDPMQLRELSKFDTFCRPPPTKPASTVPGASILSFRPGTVVISDISNGLFVLHDHTATLVAERGPDRVRQCRGNGQRECGYGAVSVRRNGGFAGAVSVQYATSDGTATAGGDYTAASGTLNWAAGELDERTISVPLINDSVSEGTETFRVTLSNSDGRCHADGAPTLDVSISNDDIAPAAKQGGGGGVSGVELLGLLGLLLLATGGERKPAAVPMIAPIKCAWGTTGAPSQPSQGNVSPLQGCSSSTLTAPPARAATGNHRSRPAEASHQTTQPAKYRACRSPDRPRYQIKPGIASQNTSDMTTGAPSRIAHCSHARSRSAKSLLSNSRATQLTIACNRDKWVKWPVNSRQGSEARRVRRYSSALPHSTSSIHRTSTISRVMPQFENWRLGGGSMFMKTDNRMPIRKRYASQS